MKISHACKIHEYKYSNNIHYVNVEWSDGTLSWTRLSSLKSKDLLYSFIQKAISILWQEAKDEEEKIKKAKEASILSKVMSNNLESSLRNETAHMKVFNQIVKDSKIKQEAPDSGMTKIQPMNSNIFNGQFEKSKSPSFPFTRNTDPILSAVPSRLPEKSKIDSLIIQSEIKTPISEIPAKKRAISRSIVNTIVARVDENFIIETQFFCHDQLATLCFEPKNLHFVNFKNIYAHLYNLFILKNKDFGFYPSVEASNHQYSEIESLMKQTNTSLVGVCNNIAWIILPCQENQYAFRHCFSSKFIIVKVKMDNFISDLINLEVARSKVDLWAKDTYKLGVDLLNVSMFRKVNLPACKNVFILGSQRTLVGIHIHKLASCFASVTTNFLAADLILIQEFYLPFIHHVPHFYDVLKTNVKFLVQKGLSFEEILPKGGFITFSPEVIEQAELLEISDLLEIVFRKPTWEFKVTKSLYNILKRRLSSQSTLPDYLHKMKLIYKAFKDNLVDCDETNLISYLEKKNYMTHRHFIEVVMIKTNEYSYSFNEAMKVVISN